MCDASNHTMESLAWKRGQREGNLSSIHDGANNCLRHSDYQDAGVTFGAISATESSRSQRPDQREHPGGQGE